MPKVGATCVFWYGSRWFNLLYHNPSGLALGGSVVRDVTLVNHKKGSKRMPPFEELKVFSGTAHRKLAQAVCDYLNVPLGKSNVFKFRNDNTFVQFEENIRERDVFIVQPFSVPVNDHIMELLIMIDAAKRASAGRITAVIPYYAYGRTDKKDQPRVPITGRLIADLLSVAGADRVLTLDLHAGQIQGFFDVPVDELTALGMLSTYFKDLVLKDAVVAAVDIGEPDCKLVNPFWVNPLEGSITLEPFLNNVTREDEFMMSSDKILTLADPTPTLLEKYQDLIKE